MQNIAKKWQRLRKKIIKALYYPLIVLFVAILITVALLIFVIPQFSRLFASVGAELPIFTQIIMKIAEHLQQQGLQWLAIMSVIGFGAKFVLARSVLLQQYKDRWLLKIPLFGGVCQHIIFVRCFKTLSMTLQAGLPLLNALQLTAQISGNHLYANTWSKIAEKINTGLSFQEALRNHRCFPNRVIQMINIGEESGRLEQMLSKLCDYYTEKIDHFVSSLNQLLEPAMMIFLSVVIGALVISVYLPIFRLGSVI